MKKKLTALTLALVMALSTVITASAASVENFNDVKTSDWFYSAVKYCASEGIVNGTSDTTFTPKGTMTRAEFITMLANMNGVVSLEDLDQDSRNNWYAATTFNDKIPSWAANQVNWAYRYGLITPAGDKAFEDYNFTDNDTRVAIKAEANNKFRANDPITREEMAEILGKYVLLLGAQNYLTESTESPAAYTDAKTISSSAYEYAEVCRIFGLIIGDNKGNLNPSANLTRAEGATVMMRVSQMLVKGLAGQVEFPQWMVASAISTLGSKAVVVGETKHISELDLKIYPVGSTWSWDDFTYERQTDNTLYGKENRFTITKDGYITGLTAGSQTILVHTPDGGTIQFGLLIKKA